MPDWVPEWFGTLTGIEIAIWATAIIATLGGLRKAWPSLKALGIFLNALAELPKFMATTTAAVGELKHEVLPNHGGSLRDAIDRTEIGLDEVREKLNNDNVRITVLEATQPRDERGRFSKGE